MQKKNNRIVFLDAGTVDYGDVSFSELKSLGRFTAYSFTPRGKIAGRLKDASVVITNKCGFDRGNLARLPWLRAIHVAATGVNNIDLGAARERGIAVTNVSGYSTESVVQAAFGFLLALAGNLVKYNQAAHDGAWSRSPFFTLGKFPIQEIAGKKIGIVGYGAIGRRVAEVARAFAMRVLVARIPGRVYPKKDKVRRVPFERAIRESDFLSLHAPLTDDTQRLINRKVLAKMKPGACLINMARGGLVDEKDLRAALESGRLRGAASDVLTAEPPPKNHVLLGAPNFLLTPHVAWASLEARKRLVHEIALNIRAHQLGKKRNRVV